MFGSIWGKGYEVGTMAGTPGTDPCMWGAMPVSIGWIGGGGYPPPWGAIAGAVIPPGGCMDGAIPMPWTKVMPGAGPIICMGGLIPVPIIPGPEG